jgi:hypothetical protein
MFNQESAEQQLSFPEGVEPPTPSGSIAIV